ncbi:MAG: hypothetical protein IKV65_04420, partial [Erysipelotrichaceae bacterium]|nr:hypothetical protein [Erysipelotrichaceae bacterium]
KPADGTNLETAGWKQFNGTLTITDASHQKNYTFVAQSGSGKVSEPTTMFVLNINKNAANAPTVSGNPDKWVNQDVTFSLTGDTRFESVKQYEYRIISDQNSAPAKDGVWGQWTVLKGEQKYSTLTELVTDLAAQYEQKNYSSESHTVMTNPGDSHVYYVQFRTRSNLDIYSNTTDVITVKVDKKQPVSATVQITDTQKDLTTDLNIADASAQDLWYFAKNIQVSLAQESFSSDNSIRYTLNGENEVVLGGGTTHTIQLIDGVNTLKIQSVDAAGNVSAEKTYTIRAEFNIPELNVVAKVNETTINNGTITTNERTIESGTWVHSPMTFTLTGTMTAALNQFEISTDNGSTWSALSTSDLIASVSQVTSSNNVHTIHVTLADKAFNAQTLKFRVTSKSGAKSEPVEFVVNVDKTSPVISKVEYSYVTNTQSIASNLLHELTGGMFFGQKIQVKVTVNETNNLSGLKHVRWWTESNTPTVLSAESAGWTVNATTAEAYFILDVDKVNVYQLNIDAWDVANNKSETKTINNIVVDDTKIDAPKVEVKVDSTNENYPAEAPWRAQDIVFTVTQPDNIGLAGIVGYQYSLDGTNWYSTDHADGNVVWQYSETVVD